ncbi:MAG TPA: RDD family protein [Sphingomonadaceae bacterium]
MSAPLTRDPAQPRRRVLTTPEGLVLPLTLGSRGARAGALVLDLMLIGFLELVVTLVAILVVSRMIGSWNSDDLPPGLELLAVMWIAALFLFRYGYFLYFELGPRGATPGKRAAGIRIAARDGGRLTAEAVIARNLLRDIEIFLPLAFLASASAHGGLANWAAFAWFLLFVLFIFFNKDRMRAGDLIAGTWVVEAPKRKLEQALSLGEAAHGHSAATGAAYRFGDAELSIYGEYELQALEQVLRDDQQAALVAVAEAICTKIGWNAGSGDERAFLEAFYAQLRAKLERDMRFGKRKADKYS